MPSRELVFRVFRHNPNLPGSSPRLQEFALGETPRMTLYTALTRLREEQDPSLQFDFVCRSAVCGSCAILVNGRPRLACRTRTAELPRKITLLPMPFFRLVADLSVDTGSWFRDMGRRVESWIENARAFDPEAEEARMSDTQAQKVYELDRCIECGCCLAACGAAQMRQDYVGAAGLLRVARFLADPRDQRTGAQFFEAVGSDDGVFGCVGFMACQDWCPKGLPLATQIAYLRRKLALTALKGRENSHPPAEPVASG